MPNKFEGPKSVDFQLIDSEGKKAGKVRLAPNRVGWCPKGKQKWKMLTMEKFAELAQEHGADVTK